MSLDPLYIPCQWYAILDARELGRRKPLGVTRLGQKLVLWRDRDGRPQALDDRCPHRGASLARGRLIDGCVECPFHGFQFAGDGACRVMPCESGGQPLKGYRARHVVVREEHGWIWLWTGPEGSNDGSDDGLGQGLPPVRYFARVTEPGWSFGTYCETWHTQYTRVLENNLDYAHLPFVHKTTIGRGVPPDQGSEIVVEDGRVWVKPDNSRSRTDGSGTLEAAMPNTWLLVVSAKLCIVGVFAPIDEEHTAVYFRGAQRLIRIPVVRALFDRLFTLSNKVVARQDRPIVESQRPRGTDGDLDERLVAADTAIARYRQMRKQLMQAGRGK